MQSYLKSALDSISIKQLFPTKPNLFFRPIEITCSCGKALKVYKTKRRALASLAIGEFSAHITHMHCAFCKKIYINKEIESLAPEQCKFCFDVIVYVGEELFIAHRSDLDIQQSLVGKNVAISLREIAYLGKKFIIYLALCHQACQEEIKKHMDSNGGYILHLDGTCEGDSPHLISSIDGISRIVLDNIKLPSENAKQLKPYLTRIKEAYGDPIAVVHDMSSAIINAVEFVFPDAKDFICHYHFLRDLGKDLFGDEYDMIRKHWRTFKTYTHLRKIARELKDHIEQDNELHPCLQNYLAKKPDDIVNSKLPSIVIIYILIVWIIEAKSASSGYGFPFDRPHLDFCYRLQEAYPFLERLTKEMPSNAPKLSLINLNRALKDKRLKQRLESIQEKIIIFDELREAMRIALPEGKDGLNDEGEDDINTIETRVKKFRESDQIKQLASKKTTFKKMVKQIDKYWDKLFADPITIETEAGLLIIQPQRTNNLLESFFRFFKCGSRKKSGTSKLKKILKSILADTPLVKNLQIPEYEEIILNGKATLAERFAEVDVKVVREKLKQKDEESRKYPKGMTRLFKISRLPEKLSKLKSNKVMAT